MFDLIKGVLKLSGDRRKKIIASYIFTFFDGMLSNVPVFTIGYVLHLIILNDLQEKTYMIVLIILIASVLLRIILKYIISVLEQGGEFLHLQNNVFLQEIELNDLKWFFFR